VPLLKTTNLSLDGISYKASLLTISEYERATVCLLKMKDSAEDPLASLESMEGLLKVLHGAIVRAGSNVTLEELSDQITPACVIEALVVLLKTSMNVSIPTISLRAN